MHLMGAASPCNTTFEDYLVGEAASDVRHEWCDGVVYAMSRGTPEHARLTMRIARVISASAGDRRLSGQEETRWPIRGAETAVPSRRVER